MIIKQSRGDWVILMTFVIALALTILPLPYWADIARPEWAVLVLIYWCTALPEKIGIFVGWTIGLMLDVLHGAILGQYALAMALIAYFVLFFHKRMRNYTIWQQSIVVMMLVLMEQLLMLWIRGMVGKPPSTLLYWSPSLTTMLLWPWIYLFLREVRLNFRVE